MFRVKAVARASIMASYRAGVRTRGTVIVRIGLGLGLVYVWG
jgi:hypothetical protein